jgi:hypothetical protein
MQGKGLLMPALAFCLLTPNGGCRSRPLSPVTQDTDELVEYVKDPNSIVKWYHFWGARKNVTGWYPSDYRMGAVYRTRCDIYLEPFTSGRHAGNFRALASDNNGNLGETSGGAPPPGSTDVLSAGTRVRFMQMWIEADGKTDAVVVPYVSVLDGNLLGRWVALDAVSIKQRRDNNDVAHPCNVDEKYLEVAEQSNNPWENPPPGIPPLPPPQIMPSMPANVNVQAGNGSILLGPRR